MDRTSPDYVTPTWSQPSNFRVFRAVITDVTPVVGTNKHRIFVQDISLDGEVRGKPLEVKPASPIPFSDLGGGMIALPDKDMQCLVAYDDVEGSGQILTYTPLVDNMGAPAQGRRIPENVQAGGYYMKVGGQVKSVFSMSRGGLMSMFTGKFGFLKIDGGNKLIEMSNKKFEHTSAVGNVQNSYWEEDTHTGLDERTSHIETYAQTFQPGHPTLMSEETEQVLASLETTKYDSRALVRAGTIANRAKPTEFFLQNPYQIEAWQSLGLNALHKDSVTIVRFGHQAGRNEGVYKYHTDDFYPPGTQYEIESKTNTGVTTSSMLWRYGKYTDDMKTRSSLGVSSIQEYVKGEVFRHQIYTDITPGLAIPLTDPVAAGKGYDLEIPKTLALQQYTDSFGVLDTHPDLRDTIWRRHIHAYDPVAPVGYSLTDILGGDNIFVRTLEHAKTPVTGTTFTQTIADDVATINYEVKGVAGTTTYKIEMGTNGVTISKQGLVNTGSVEITDAGITINAGLIPNVVTVGGSGAGQALVTKSWVDLMFATHVHPTAAPGPPSPPLPVPAVANPSAASPYTFQTKAS